MSETPSTSPFDFVRQFTERLRYPQLFTLTAVLFAIDLFVPDMIPFVDEILLGLLTLLLGRLKDRKKERPKERDRGWKDVTPKG